MTLPFERMRSVLYTKQFLEELLNPQKTPRIPSPIRGKAKALLRHYPMAGDVHRASNWAADVFGPVPEVYIGADAVRVKNFTFTLRYQLAGGGCNEDEFIKHFGAAGLLSLLCRGLSLAKPRHYIHRQLMEISHDNCHYRTPPTDDHGAFCPGQSLPRGPSMVPRTTR